MAGRDSIIFFASLSEVSRGFDSLATSFLISSKFFKFLGDEIKIAWRGLFSCDLAYSTTFNLFDWVCHLVIALVICSGVATLVAYSKSKNSSGLSMLESYLPSKISIWYKRY